MKKFVFALSCLTFASGFASAQTCKGIGILQAQAALGSTKEGKAADDDLNNRLSGKAAELKKRDENLKALQDKINRGGNTMSDTAKAALQKEYDTTNRTLTRDKQDFEDEANAEVNKVQAELADKLKKVIDKVSKDGNYCLVLNVSDPNTPVVYFSDETDITGAVIDAYDKQAASAPAKSVLSPVNPAKPVAGPPKTPAPPPAAPKTPLPGK